MHTAQKKDLPTTDETKTVPDTKGMQHPLLGLRQEVDSLFDNFFSNFSLGPFGRHGADYDPFRRLGTALTPARGFMPSMDIRETDKEFIISAELPGMDEADVEISLEDNQMIIMGEKKQETTSDDEDRHLMERHYGSIYRSLPLPDDVDGESAEAEYDKGVLTITLKKIKVREKAAKKIKIKTK